MQPERLPGLDRPLGHTGGQGESVRTDRGRQRTGQQTLLSPCDPSAGRPRQALNPRFPLSWWFVAGPTFAVLDSSPIILKGLVAEYRTFPRKNRGGQGRNTLTLGNQSPILVVLEMLASCSMLSSSEPDA